MGRAEVTPERARQVLGVPLGAGSEQVRAAYRRLLLRTHPDLSTAEDATTRTVALTAAYRVLIAERAQTLPEPAQQRSTGEPGRAVDVDECRISMVDRDTIGVAAPPADTLMMLIDAAHRLGEVSYLDPSAGLLEVVVEFQDAPTSSLVLSLQGRATGITEVFCTVEPLSGGDSPPVEAVARLVLRTLSGEDPST